ncbi:hypothetical protein Salat_2080800 [Sesamum alatum]|uniref:Uncharacterized protein n=1 Tax=Sesamum alatum TaxID=300844 RepID=A0AAE1Y1G1_9LAMI|nr:hypothetical protein Salat_2080800 [Sesamum alatum]
MVIFACLADHGYGHYRQAFSVSRQRFLRTKVSSPATRLSHDKRLIVSPILCFPFANRNFRQVKHLRMWIYECRDPSSQAFNLGLAAVVLFDPGTRLQPIYWGGSAFSLDLNKSWIRLLLTDNLLLLPSSCHGNLACSYDNLLKRMDYVGYCIRTADLGNVSKLKIKKKLWNR